MKSQFEISEPHSISAEEIVAKLQSNATSGLSDAEAKKRLELLGTNILTSKEGVSVFHIILVQFLSPMVYMLLVAAGLSFFFKEWLDGIAILIVILINAIIGFVMEFQSEKAMASLKKMVQLYTKVIRNSKTIEVSSDDLVPGDIVFLEAGDMIPADCRLIQLSALQVDESSLTGESLPVEKIQSVLPSKTNLAEQTNMLFRGTFITKGNAIAIVCRTGMETELGKIASMVESAEQSATPLEKKINEFSKKLIKITVVLVIVIFIAGLLYGDEFISILSTSIALAVAAIPEGLPIVATLALAQGMMRMARRKVLVKRLQAVETLGGTTVICTDKTGTLTENKIVVSEVWTPDEKIIVHGNADSNSTKSFKLIQEVSVLCNTAEFYSDNGNVKEVGDPLETGLLKFAYESGVNIQTLRKEKRKIKEDPFSLDTRMMTTIHENPNNYFVAAKGSVEQILKKCTRILSDNVVRDFTETEKQNWHKRNEELAASGLRIIGEAYNEPSGVPNELTNDLIFLGLIGMMDPPRTDVRAAISECRKAGIKVVMITGDHPATAKNIAQSLGLIDDESENVINGDSIGKPDEITPEQKTQWSHAKIFARVNPRQKLDLVTTLQEQNNIVGMTGDGVNDAPALKKADIGIAMGLRGTQVAQEVADIILKNDSFSSIVLAIKQGRIIYENIRKFIIYLLSCNLSELFIVSTAAVFNLHYGLFPLQILYINIVTDVLPALALGVTEGSDSIMDRKPRDVKEPIIDRKRWISIFVYSGVITVCTLSAVLFAHEFIHGVEGWNSELCNNILFITLILSQIWHVFNMTTDRVSFFQTDVFRNKYIWYAITICLVITVGAFYVGPVAKALSLYWPSAEDFAVMFGFSLLSLIINQFLKRIKLVL